MKLQFIEAGQIVTTHGVKGEVKVLPWGDSPEFLKGFKRAVIDGQPVVLEHVRVQNTCDLVKIKGVDTVEAGMALKDKVLSVYREDCDPDTIFGSELIGMEVYADGSCIGKLEEVLDYPGNMVYVVRGAYEYMLPAVKEFILSTDLEGNRMEVKLLEGMRSDED